MDEKQTLLIGDGHKKKLISLYYYYCYCYCYCYCYYYYYYLVSK